jgi:deoxyribodipyrimidine photo-lyase
MQVQQQLQREGIEVRSFSGNLLFDPENISNQSGSFFKVFTPFWRHCVSSQHPRSLYPIPTIRPFEHVPQSVDIATWSSLLPQNPNWSQKFTAYWKPGERHGHQLLAAFAEKTITTYAKDRDFPSLQGTSRLSPYLHFGELSPHQVWYKVQEIGTGNVLGADAERYLAEIGWREFAYHLLYHCPTLPSQPFNHKFDTFPWQFDATLFNKWKRGMTGYPIVDAGMRELWESGWMHNRVRMVVASFLTKHLLIPWQAGAEWFLDTLLDADLANNAAGWQWVAGCGADAAPYFRVFNPVMQGKKFDPSGKYIRRWIPELRALPDGYIHSPWEASSNVLAVSDVQLGNTYPNPIVEHAFARKRALALYANL